MKIEMGESLILSWLKHVKKCQIVQLNWAVSQSWTFENKDIIDQLMIKSNNLFQEKYGYNIYKNNSLEQLIGQSEVDVVGVSFDENGDHIYAVDIAFHEAGLNYGSRDETVSRVVKKCIRTAMCMLGCFNISYGDIIFASPKINPSVYNDLVIVIEDVNAILLGLGLEYDVKILANEAFEGEILDPVLQLSKEVSDTNELFMRSIQMCNLFYINKEKRNIPLKSKVNSDNKIAQSQADCIPGFENMKIAEIVRTELVKILENEIYSPAIIEKMQTKEYSKENFDLQYSLLLKKNDLQTRPVRYMAKPIVNIHGQEYYLCSEWYEKPGGNNDRPYLLNWIKTHREGGIKV
jgi:hypothetical protein